MGVTTDSHVILVGNPEEKKHLKYPGVDARIILKWIFEKWD
jgi:hypothetical protein